MPVSRETQLTFWDGLARALGRGEPVVPALEALADRLAGTQLDRVCDDLVRALREGHPLSSTMADRRWAFSGCECAMMRAGEASGTLDVVTARVVDGLRDESFPVPEIEGRDADDPVRYWRALGRLLGSCVPMLEALRLVAREVAGPRLAEATQAMRQAILDGRPMVEGMRAYHEVFPEEVCRAVETAQEEGTLAEQALRIAEALESESLTSLIPDMAAGEQERGEAAMAFVAQVLRAAVEQGASDVHLDPTSDGRGRVRLRVDGQLREMEPPPNGLFPHIVRQTKSDCDLDPEADGLPQEGHISLNLGGRPFDLRVGILPTVSGERLVLRVLDRAAGRLDLDQMDLLPDDLAAVRELCQLPSGLILCNGPAGSGKTALLYALLHEVDRERRSVVSVEDPVEYRIEGVAQVPVAPEQGLSLAQAVQSVLRQDPDVLMVHALSNLALAEQCVHAALTGHLVLSTLSAGTSPAALRRLLDIGLEPFLINGALSAIISQRLVRVLCPACKRQAEPSVASLPPAAMELVERVQDAAFCGPQGCDACDDTGYRGRTAIHEILIPTERVHHAVAARADAESIRNAALAGGMRPMLACGIEKAARGLTSLQEVCRVVPHGNDD